LDSYKWNKLWENSSSFAWKVLLDSFRKNIIMKKTTTLLFSITVSLYSIAQFSQTVLDHNNVSTEITDAGILFNNPTINTSGYEIPKGSGQNAIYAAGFWFAAENNSGELRTCASHFIPGQDIFPGPIANPGEYTSASYMNDYLTSLWTVTKIEVDDHISNWDQPGYVVPAGILNWPGNGDVTIGVALQLAPYVDVNANNIYEPSLGDYPNIRGDKATYVIMNDVAALHAGTGTTALGIEVHLMLYQFSTTNYLNNTTFVNARVYNRGADTYSDFRSSFFADGDLGNYSDDYYGCDSVLNTIYTYNGDADDEGAAGMPGYGTNPPAIGITSLSHPMAGAGYFTNAGGFPLADPTDATHYWNFMHNMWADGTPWVYGGTGYPGSTGATSAPTNYLFGGEPLDQAQWSEASTDFLGTANPPGDRRMFMNLPGVSLAPGDKVCYDYAVVYGRDSVLGSINDLKLNAASVQTFFDGQNYGCEEVVLGLENISTTEFSVHPNPSDGRFRIELDDAMDVAVLLTDASGRTVPVTKVFNHNYIDIQVENGHGIFFVTVISGDGSTTKRIVIL
jgi:hypothetical protein